ncbi:Serine/threonine-protein kinase pknF [Nocardia otitidiscaviarum]|uniref:non-specific serine/threonine protein kinase n=1 Tax=Nocardia otitidiscaviarum TaxID=1823 RepID=A0A378YND3_9NOCA|nr:serine/threonine-protein kinase [Nocardia otitidiscaviarum]SUA78715.1 Serine/threonine-protein kinase pknF [Nocardia otitidiscaviarum]
MRAVTPGAVVAGYRIERRLGTGGTGSVHLARHPRLPRHDAVKVLSRGADPEFRARFLREADLAGRLDHPNIVAIYDCGGEGDMLWIAMQYVDGSDAAELVRRHRGGLPAERAVAIVTGAARGLDHAHRAGLLHRDVKPANILVERGAPGAERVLVTDFGIARATTETDARTAAGRLLATLAFAAPEQINGGDLDPRTDVYALGCTLYQLLTGSVPFPRETAAAVMNAHLTAPRPRPTDIVLDLPSGLDIVIARAMATNPQERYSSCGELAAAAAAALRGELVASPLTRRRNRRAFAIAAVGAAALIVISGAVVVAQRVGGSHEKPVATPPITAAVSPWGTAGFIVDAFPGLLPATPSDRGHDDLRCTAADDANQAVAADVVLEQPRIVCTGRVSALWVSCRRDRSPMPIEDPPARVIGRESWSRASGSGHLIWSDLTTDGVERGRLDIWFDDDDREFCKL